jgi:hypothetical protein
MSLLSPVGGVRGGTTRFLINSQNASYHDEHSIFGDIVFHVVAHINVASTRGNAIDQPR